MQNFPSFASMRDRMRLESQQIQRQNLASSDPSPPGSYRIPSDPIPTAIESGGQESISARNVSQFYQNSATVQSSQGKILTYGMPQSSQSFHYKSGTNKNEPITIKFNSYSTTTNRPLLSGPVFDVDDEDDRHQGQAQVHRGQSHAGGQSQQMASAKAPPPSTASFLDQISRMKATLGQQFFNSGGQSSSIGSKPRPDFTSSTSIPLSSQCAYENLTPSSSSIEEQIQQSTAANSSSSLKLVANQLELLSKVAGVRSDQLLESLLAYSKLNKQKQNQLSKLDPRMKIDPAKQILPTSDVTSDKQVLSDVIQRLATYSAALNSQQKPEMRSVKTPGLANQSLKQNSKAKPVILQLSSSETMYETMAEMEALLEAQKVHSKPETPEVPPVVYRTARSAERKLSNAAATVQSQTIRSDDSQTIRSDKSHAVRSDDSHANSRVAPRPFRPNSRALFFAHYGPCSFIRTQGKLVCKYCTPPPLNNTPRYPPGKGRGRYWRRYTKSVERDTKEKLRRHRVSHDKSSSRSRSGSRSSRSSSRSCSTCSEKSRSDRSKRRRSHYSHSKSRSSRSNSRSNSRKRYSRGSPSKSSRSRSKSRSRDRKLPSAEAVKNQSQFTWTSRDSKNVSIGAADSKVIADTANVPLPEKTGPVAALVSESSKLSNYCRVCDVHCGNKEEYKKHFASEKHKKNIRHKINEYRTQRKNYSCNVCRVTCPGYQTFMGHMRSKNHEKNLKASKSSENPSTSSNSTSQPKPIEQANTDQNIVGADFLEKQMGLKVGKQSVYYCKLCDCKLQESSREVHLRAKTHRLAYKTKVDPNFQVQLSRVEQKIQNARVKHDIMRKLNQEAATTAQIASIISTVTQSKPPTRVIPPYQYSEKNVMNNLLEKEKNISARDEELARLKEAVKTVETALKMVSDVFVDRDNELPTTSTSAKSAGSGSESSRFLKGVMRVGDLDKRLVLTNQLREHFVVICLKRPTLADLRDVYSCISVQFSAMEERYDVEIDERENLITVDCYDKPNVVITITMTSNEVRNPDNGAPIEGTLPDSPDLLDSKKCLESLALLRRSRWFQGQCSPNETMLKLLRILKELCQRIPTWTPVPFWALQILVDRMFKGSVVPITLAQAFRHVFEILASGILLKSGAGNILKDPCETNAVDPFQPMTAQQREYLTASAQHALRLIAFGQIRKILALDEIQEVEMEVVNI